MIQKKCQTFKFSQKNSKMINRKIWVCMQSGIDHGLHKNAIQKETFRIFWLQVFRETEKSNFCVSRTTLCTKNQTLHASSFFGKFWGIFQTQFAVKKICCRHQKMLVIQTLYYYCSYFVVFVVIKKTRVTAWFFHFVFNSNGFRAIIR